MATLSGKTLVLATHNLGKIDEMRALLAPYGVTVRSAMDFGLEAPEETEKTFVGNARIKARYVAEATGQIALADDSGIEVEALGGAPGVHTADWAETGAGRDFEWAMRKTWDLVQSSGESGPFLARFCSTVVLCWPDGREDVFEGTVNGQLVWPMRGVAGHGYDPMFQPSGYSITFAEMAAEEKNRISHRADAFQKLIAHCFT